jgi:hypothetical protein
MYDDIKNVFLEKIAFALHVGVHLWGVTHVKLMAKVISLSKIGAHGCGLHLRHGYRFGIIRLEQLTTLAGWCTLCHQNRL